ncbi:MAG TPA: prolipoprotein diacylglyceryl transferase [Caldilineaceae bacterium]|nr:prolipoprotein diacylglyceryl transferase [Caldilineaceae bacterium]
MITISIDPILISIGHFMIRWYSLIVLAATLVGIWIAGREAERKGLGKETIYELATWLIPAGIVGARLFHVIDHWDHEYSANPLQALYIWQGGLAIWGGVIGGLVALAVLARRRGWRLPLLLDILAVAVVLGQGIGRLACVITGDAMGKPTSGPFGIAYTNPHTMVPELGVYYTPTPVYEAIMNMSIFALLWQLRKKNLPEGALFLIYLVLYSSGRFLITFWSSYRTIAFGMNQAQIISLAAFAVGLPLLIYVLRRHSLAQAMA